MENKIDYERHDFEYDSVNSMWSYWYKGHYITSTSLMVIKTKLARLKCDIKNGLKKDLSINRFKTPSVGSQEASGCV